MKLGEYREQLVAAGPPSGARTSITLFLGLLGAGVAFAQPPGDCVVNILNRTGVVGTDGRWRVENVPTLQGPVRARFTCTSNGVTQYGQTPFFEILRTNQTTAFPAGITLGNFQVPSSLSITAPVTTLNGPGTSTQGSVVVTFHDGVTRDVTTAASFTSYFSSNSQLATVSPNGLITATGVGSVIITTVYDGVSSFLPLDITRGGDSDNDGIPDSAELLLGLLPNNPVDALEDPDGDGLTNLDEYRLNSDLRNPDTDGDGVPDGLEVRLGLNVRLADGTTIVAGRITDGAGGAIPNALVSVFGTINAFTDAGGNYTLRFVPAGLGLLTIQALVRTPLVRTGILANLNPVVGGTTSAPPIVLTGDTGSVIGLVTNALSQPVANAPLTLQVGILSVGGTTNATGHYRFDGVPAGTISLSGLDTVSGARGSTLGALAANATLTLNLSVSATGVVAGTVVAADGVTQLAQVRVTLTAGTTVLTVFTDVLGRYRFEAVPVGGFTVDADLAGNRARLTSTVPAAGVTVTADLRMTGVGAVTVTALEGSNPVPGVAIRVTSTALGINYDASTDTNGLASFPRVLAGGFSVTGTRTSPSQTRTGNGTLAINGSASVSLIFDPGQTGAAVSGRLLNTDGVTPIVGGLIQLRNTVTNAVSASINSGPDGSYRFDAIPIGSFAIEYLNGGQALARDYGVITAATDVLVRNLVAVATGSVNGTVRNPDSSPAAGLTVSVRSLNAIVGGTFTATTAANGTYSVSAVPIGEYQATVFDSVRLLSGEGTGTLTAGGTATTDLQLQTNTVPLPRSLWDANNRLFDIQNDGRILRGDTVNVTLTTFTGASTLELTIASSTARFLGEASARTELAGRQLAVRQPNVNGMQVTRKIYVPRDGYFARYVELITNPTGAPVTLTARLSYPMPVAAERALTSSGDPALDVSDGQNPDRWVSLGAPFTFGNTPLPARGIAFDGIGARTRAASAVADFDTGVTLSWSNLAIPAGGTVALMHFVTQHPDQEKSRVILQHLQHLPPEAIAGLSGAEIAQIRNFAIPADGTSSLAAQLPINGSISTSVLDWNGTLPAVGTRVEFVSNSLFFNRTITATPSANGAVSFVTAFTANGTSTLVPLTGYRLRIVNPVFGTTPVSEVLGNFNNGLPTTPATIRLTGTGNFSSNLTFPSGTVPTFLQIRVNDTIMNNLPASGPYTFTALPPVTAQMEVQIGHPQGTRVQRTFPILARVSETQGLALFPPMGRITGKVTQGGSPVANVRVEAAFQNTIRTTFTNAQGDYTLLDLDVAEYPLIAEIGSNRSAPQTVLVQAGQQAVRNLELQGTGSVEVRVLMPGGIPVPNAFVSGQITDANGRALISNLPIVPTTFELYHPVYDHLRASGTVTPAVAPPATLDLIFPQTGTVTGIVTRANGTVLENSQVSAGCGERNAFNFSNAQGRFTIPMIPIQRNCLAVAFDPSFANFVVSPSFQIATAGQTVTQDLRLSALATLLVTFRDSNNLPIANGTVDISYTRGVQTLHKNQGTNASGVATFLNITEGLVSIQARGGQQSQPGIATAAATIRPEDDAGTVNVTVTMGSPGTVQGTVFAADGATPIPDAQLDVLDLASGTSVVPPLCGECPPDLRTDANGLYNSGPVVVGSLGFRVSVIRPGAEGSNTIVVSDTGQFTSPNQIVTKNLITPYSVIRGTVYRGDGIAPASGASVFVNQGAQVYFAYTDEQGRYTVFGVPVGSFTVQVQQGILFREVPGSLTAANVPATVNVTLEQAGTVRGIVRSALTQPVADALVGIGLRDPSFSASVNTDATGAYEFVDVPLGNLFIEAQDPLSLLSGSTATTLSTVGEIRQADLTLESPSTVLGQARRADGVTPLSNSDIRLESLEIGPLGGVRRFAGADGSGNFGFGNFPAGPVRVLVTDVNDATQTGFADGLAVGNQVAILNPQVGATVTLGTHDLDGSNGFRHSFGCGGLFAGGGTIDQRLGSPFQTALIAPGAGCQDVARLSTAGRQLEYGPQYSRGLAMSRRVYVPANGNFARYVDTFLNTTALSTVVEFTSTGAYSNWPLTARLVADPNTNGRTFAVTDDPAGCCTPSVAVVMSGAGGRVSPTDVRFPQTGQDISTDFSYKWRLAIPAGQSLSILQFFVQRERLDTTGAVAQAQALTNLTDPNALTGLSPVERTQIANFNVQ